MNENEDVIRYLDNSIISYKKDMTEASTGKSRKIFKDAIKKMEIEKQLILLKERNIKG